MLFRQKGRKHAIPVKDPALYSIYEYGGKCVGIKIV
jgi:hypothetical protein